MRLIDVGEIIAIRDLNFTDSSGAHRTVSVTIGKPQPFPDDEGGYYCAFRISSIDLEKLKYAAGTDAIQALQLVMPMIAANLKLLESEARGNLTWSGGSPEDPIGFPSTV
jgi:hypothetical protein